jgi:hypothetical protein
MKAKLSVLVAALLVAGTASAMHVHMDDFYADLDAIAEQLALEPSLPKAGLGAYWPAEVAELAELPPIVAAVSDPAALNAALGEGAGYQKGDFVVLRARDGGFGARFFTRGRGWDYPLATDALTVADFRVVCAARGVVIKVWGDPHVSLREGGSLFVGAVEDPAAFIEAFGVEDEVVKDQGVVLRQGPSGVVAHLVAWRTNVPTTTQLVVADGEVRVEVLK